MLQAYTASLHNNTDTIQILALHENILFVSFPAALNLYDRKISTRFLKFVFRPDIHGFRIAASVQLASG